MADLYFSTARDNIVAAKDDSSQRRIPVLPFGLYSVLAAWQCFFCREEGRIASIFGPYYIKMQKLQ